MATTKRHELFIPFPDDPSQQNDRIAIAEKALARFNGLAQERAEENDNNRMDGRDKNSRPKDAKLRKPYLPFRSDAEEQQDWRVETNQPVLPSLRPGQLVYFDVEAEAGKPIVSEIAFSAIWRNAPMNDAKGRPAELFDFIGQVDAELLPYHEGDAAKPGRASITPAERLFGFVAQEERNSGAKQPAGTSKPRNALMGRVRFSLAQIESDARDYFREDDNDLRTAPADFGHLRGYSRLKILSSPKPPAPSFYFRRRIGDAATSKRDLKLGTHEPQGRKMYLHHRLRNAQDGAVTTTPWVTAARVRNDDVANQKNAVRPIHENVAFWFHIDFDNLESEELDLLCFALRPTERFRHKLGMGKGLGLGSIRVEPQAIFFIDRKRRYQADDLFTARRYHHCRIDGALATDQWPDTYRTERTEAESAARETDKDNVDRQFVTVSTMARRYYQERKNHSAIHALLAIGENRDKQPEGLGATGRPTGTLLIPVQTPVIEGATDPEKETYQWFVNNEQHVSQNKRQWLKPITEEGSLPSLKPNKQPPKDKKY